MKKRLFSFLMAMLLWVSLVPGALASEEPAEEGPVVETAAEAEEDIEGSAETVIEEEAASVTEPVGETGPIGEESVEEAAPIEEEEPSEEPATAVEAPAEEAEEEPQLDGFHASEMKQGMGWLLVGDSTLIVDRDIHFVHISGDSNRWSLTIRYEGSYTVTVDEGIYGVRTLTVEGTGGNSRLTATGGDYGIQAYSAIKLGNGAYTLTGGLNGIRSDVGYIEMTGLSCYVTATGGREGIYAGAGAFSWRDALTISGRNITAVGGSKYPGIYADTGDIYISAWNVKATGGTHGICAAKGAVRTDGSNAAFVVEAAGGSGDGIQADTYIDLEGYRVKAKSDKGDAIYARNSFIQIIDCITEAEGKLSGIRSYGGDVTIRDGTTDVQGADAGIRAEKGSVTLNGGEVTVYSNSGPAVWAKNAVNLQGGGTVTATGSYGLYADTGAVTVDAKLTAGGSKYGIYSGGGLFFQGGPINVSGVQRAVQTKGNTGIRSPMTILTPAQSNMMDGTIYDYTTGKVATLVSIAPRFPEEIHGQAVLKGGDDEGKIEAGSQITIGLRGELENYAAELRFQWQRKGAYDWQNIWGATTAAYTPTAVDRGQRLRVVITARNRTGSVISDELTAIRTLTGTATLPEKASVGTSVSPVLSGAAAELSAEDISYQWQRRAMTGLGKFSWFDIAGATTKSYTIPAADFFHLGYRVVITAKQGYTGGEVISSTVTPEKKENTAQAAEPQLVGRDNAVWVTNAVTTQEYLILTEKKSTDELTASDWNSAVTPERDGELKLGGQIGQNWVYTRIKETADTKAGPARRRGAVLGETIYMTGIELEVVGDEYSITMGEGGSFNCDLGQVLRIYVDPVPDSATNFPGVYGDCWLVNSSSAASEYCRFYEDSACTRPLDSDTAYTKVYAKMTKAGKVVIGAQYTMGYNSLARDSFTMNVIGWNAPSRPKGDYNGDGYVNRQDRVYLARALAGWTGYDKPEDMDLSCADLDGDGVVDLPDRSTLARTLAG